MKPLKWLAFLGAIAVLLAVAAVEIHSFRLKHRADEVVRVSYGLAQQASPPSLDEIRQQFGKQLKQPDPCVPSGCGYEVKLSNEILARLHLVPFTELRSYLWVRNGVLEENRLEIYRKVNRGRLIGVSTDMRYCNGCNPFSIVPSAHSLEPTGSGSVELDYRSAGTAKRAAFAFATACLTRMHGCNTIADLLPTVWVEASDQTIRWRGAHP